jgi:hypothetical protein
MGEQPPRGSSFLVARYSEGDLQELLTAGEEAGAVLETCFPIGLPAFDGAAGSWRVTPEQLPGLIAKVAQLTVPPVVTVFPKGLPPADTVFDVTFEAGSQRTR